MGETQPLRYLEFRPNPTSPFVDRLPVSPPQYTRYASLDYLITIKDSPDRRVKT